MNSKELAKNVAAHAKDMIAKETKNEVVNIAPIVSKIIFNIYANWDGDPSTLDTDAFTIEETLTAIKDLFSHEEDEMGTGLQAHNATSQIIATESVLYVLQNELKQIQRKVKYV